MNMLTRRLIAPVALLLATQIVACGHLSRPVPMLASSQGMWMSAAAKTAPLLYVTSEYGVFVYSYPAGLLEGQLTGILGPEGPCADRTGRVFIPDIAYDTIVEYAHGNAVPVNVIAGEPYAQPIDCTIDVATGDLVVANANAIGGGDIAIYPPMMGSRGGGWGKPTIIHDPSVTAVLSCTSDVAGNVFISGMTSSLAWKIAELKRGDKRFTAIRVPTKIQQYHNIRWDGTDLAVTGNSINMYRLQITGSRASVAGVVHLRAAGAYGITGFTFNPDSDGPPRRVIVPDGGTDSVGYWRYPAGGQPQKFIPVLRPLGAVISMPVSQ